VNTLKNWVPELFFSQNEKDLEEALKPLENLQTKAFLRCESQKWHDQEHRRCEIGNSIALSGVQVLVRVDLALKL
jgi:hypothetical protein